MEFQYILFRKLPFCRLMHSLCENQTFLCEESVLLHNKRNGFQSYPDHYLKTNADNRPFAASHSRGTKTPCWRAKVALGQDKHRKLPFQIMYVFCLSCPSATFALQRGGFLPREWLAAKGLLFAALVCPPGFSCSSCKLRLHERFCSSVDGFHKMSFTILILKIICNSEVLVVIICSGFDQAIDHSQEQRYPYVLRRCLCV